VDGYRVDDKEPWLTRERKRILIELLVIFVLVFALLQVTSAEKAVASVGTVWLMYALVTVMKDYRQEVWFWVTIAFFASAHAAAILLLKFQLPKGPALSYVVPAMFADGFAMFGILKLLASRLSAIKD
jgi:hypothetical protein